MAFMLGGLKGQGGCDLSVTSDQSNSILPVAGPFYAGRAKELDGWGMAGEAHALGVEIYKLQKIICRQTIATEALKKRRG